MKMKKRTLVVILALLALILSSCSSGGNNVARTYDEALNAMMQGKYAEAADRLSGISFYQDSVQLALYCRAHAWAAEGRYADAIAELTKLGSFRDAEKAAVYFTARMEENNADTPVLRAYAANLYDADMINGFRDSMSRAEAIRSKLYAEGEAAEKAETWTEAAGIFEPLGSYRESYRRWRYATGRMYEENAEITPESWGFAVVYYDTAHDYRDSEERMERCLATAYQKADELIAAEDFDAAERIYLALGTYCDPDKHVQLMEAARRAKIAKADALMEEKRFGEARALYLEAGETEMADEALYRKAEYTALNGDIEEAAAIYMNVRDHKDSRDRHYLLGKSLEEKDPETASRILLQDREWSNAKDDLYAIALKATEQENYPLSISIYTEFQGERDCTLRMKNDLYLYGRILMEGDNPDKAAEIFDSLYGIGNAGLYANMARYAAAEKLEADGRYEAAAAAFDMIRGYADAADRATNSRYLLALEKKGNTQYQGAIDIFAAISGWKDSVAQETECRYLLARKYEDVSSWKKAIEYYESVLDYEDSRARCTECYRQQGWYLLEHGEPEEAYWSFTAADDAEGKAKAAFAVGEKRTADMNLYDALSWYQQAPELPETEERIAMVASSLLNMEEDSLSEDYASVEPGSEKAQAVLYALALRSLERKDEEAAMRQLKKAGDSADASERFRAMLNARVEALMEKEQYDDAAFLCSANGDQEQADRILEQKARKEEEVKQQAIEAARAEIEQKMTEAEGLLAEKKYDEAAEIYTAIGETELAEKALADKAAEAEAARLAEEQAAREAVKAQMDEAAALLEEGKYDEAAAAYGKLGDKEMASEAVYQKAAALGQPDLYLQIPEYKDSRELHYKAGTALVNSDPEGAFRILAADITFGDAQDVLYSLAERESKAENYRLSSEIFSTLAAQPLDAQDPKYDCLMRYTQDRYLYGLWLMGQEDWQAAADVFDGMPDTGEARERALECHYNAARQLSESGKFTQAAVAYEELGGYRDSAEQAKLNRYNAAVKQLEAGAYETAEAAFLELGDYGDAADMANQCRYMIADGLFAEGSYSEAKVLYESLGEYAEAAQKKQECAYLIAQQLMESGDYTQAVYAYQEIMEYKDAAEKVNACYAAMGDAEIARAEALLQAGNTREAASAYQFAYRIYQQTDRLETLDRIALNVAWCYHSVNELDRALDWYRKNGDIGRTGIGKIAEYALDTEQEALAEALANELDAEEKTRILYEIAKRKQERGDADAALALFEQAGDYQDAKDQQKEILYQQAARLAAEGDYTAAAEAFGQIADYHDAANQKNNALYLYAGKLADEGNLSAAAEQFRSLGEFMDAAAKAEALETEIKNRLEPGGEYEFGTYEQDNDAGNGKEPIRWTVLDVREGRALLLSKYGLDAVPYNRDDTDTTWAECTLRAWLNGEFMQAAFTEEEQARILVTEASNDAGQGCWNLDGGPATQDRIFLLSYWEANKYLQVTEGNKDNIASRVAVTDYAAAKGAFRSGNMQTAEGKPAGMWWLRSPGDSHNMAAFVSAVGAVGRNSVSLSTGTVRPALWVSLGNTGN